MNKTVLNKLATRLAKLEGKKSQTRIGDIREILALMVKYDTKTMKDCLEAEAEDGSPIGDTFSQILFHEAVTSLPKSIKDTFTCHNNVEFVSREFAAKTRDFLHDVAEQFRKDIEESDNGKTGTKSNTNVSHKRRAPKRSPQAATEKSLLVQNAGPRLRK